MTRKAAGSRMRAECAEIGERFAHALRASMPTVPEVDTLQAIYTIARGSSDAAASILAYEFMRVLSLPVTTLPPSVFSLQQGVRVANALALVISQSGASPDLVRATQGFRKGGGRVCAILNSAGAPVGQAADFVIDMQAGPELAVPATKSVVCTLAAGMALLGAMAPGYERGFDEAVAANSVAASAPVDAGLVATLKDSASIYVIGRGSGLGAAQEVALKLKECCALHAEAYSASEVLHGPLQLATRDLTVVLLDTGEPVTQDSMAEVERRFAASASRIVRIGTGAGTALVPAAAAAAILTRLYPVVLATALALGLDPDAPQMLAKVTETV